MKGEKMTKLQRLKKEALESCQFRGHRMKRFVSHSFWTTVAYAHCWTCDKQVVVDTNPQPNGIDIGGGAVALSCKD